jgi:hypothetical protein
MLCGSGEEDFFKKNSIFFFTLLLLSPLIEGLFLHLNKLESPPPGMICAKSG